MATLEDAAEALVVKLRGLDAEIEESEGALEDLRDRVEDTVRDVEQQWEALHGAASSFFDALREEQESLADRAQAAAQSVVDAQNATGADGAAARQEMADGEGQLAALAQHASGLVPEVDALAADAGEEPARDLAERARELEQLLEQLVQEARAFLEDDVASAARDTAEELRQACQTLQVTLAETAAAALQNVYDDWESMVDRLDEYVANEGYKASHQHALDVVEYALEECDAACGRQLDALQQLVGVLAGQLGEMSMEVERSAEELVDRAGAALRQELAHTRDAASAAAAALDAVRGELAAYSFVEV